MEFQQEQSDAHYINAYTENSITIDGSIYHSSVLVGLKVIKPLTAHTLDEITPDIVQSVGESGIECVIIGVNTPIKLHPVSLIATFQQQGYGCEVMTTPAACRTFNLMALDHRKVIAILLI